MATLTQQEFEDQYDIELLPYSMANPSLGGMMYYKSLFNKTLTFLNYSLTEKLGWDTETTTTIESQLKAAPLVDSSFPTLSINNSTIGSEDLKIPIIDLDLSTHVDARKVASFESSNIKAKRLTGTLRSKLAQGLTVLRDDSDKKKYRQEIKFNYIIEELFYADAITIKLHEKLAIDLSLDLTNKETNTSLVSVSPNIQKNNDTTYTIPNAGACPFAVQLTKGRLF